MNDLPIEALTRASLRATILLAACALAIVPAGPVAAASSEPDPARSAARVALQRLSLADRAGQLVVTSVPGLALRPRDAQQLRALRPGGVILFAGNVRTHGQVAGFNRQVQRATVAGDARRPRALVSIDQEGGVVKRIRDLPPSRSHPDLGRRNDVAVTKAQARATAVALRRLGIHFDLAPVADLDLGPVRVMRQRSFGTSGARVARHVSAFVDGLQAGGGAASVKHFPGFGGASVNSDDALATIGRSRRQLVSDLRPFRAAIAAGTDSVMVSHGVYRAIDRRHPASTSPAVYRLLRDELGYDGVAITDSLHAAGFGAAADVGIAQGCVRTVAAGADIALLTGTLAEAVACRRALLAAVRTGALPRARLDEAALRVLAMKARLGLLPD